MKTVLFICAATVVLWIGLVLIDSDFKYALKKCMKIHSEEVCRHELG